MITEEELAEFQERAREGHKWETYVADYFRAQGLDVAMGPQTILEKYEDRFAWVGETDMVVNARVVEVKSRPIAKPFDPLFVMALKAWQEKAQKPDAVVVVMTVPPVRMLAISGVAVERYATVGVVKDGRRSVPPYEVLQAALKYWRPIEKLLAYLGGDGRTPAEADADRRLKEWRETDYVLGIHHPHPRSKAESGPVMRLVARSP